MTMILTVPFGGHVHRAARRAGRPFDGPPVYLTGCGQYATGGHGAVPVATIRHEQDVTCSSCITHES